MSCRQALEKKDTMNYKIQWYVIKDTMNAKAGKKF